MRLNIRKFGIGSGRDLFDQEVPDDVLTYLNNSPGFAIEYLGKVSRAKLKRLLQGKAIEECGFFMVKEGTLVKFGLKKKNDWIPEDKDQICFYNEVGDMKHHHIFCLHTDYE